MLISIVTINYNNCDGLRKTIDSVVAQTFKDFEWIVIDGGSTDGSKELIEQFADHFAYWVSEPDKGIYNAMNKGIKVAKGKYLQFLNSGDWLVDENVVKDFSEASFEADIVGGGIRLIYEDYNKDVMSPKHVSFDFFIHGTLCHQSAFIKKSLFDKCGGYNENYRIVSDRDFFMRSIVVFSASYNSFNRIVACFPVNGISANPMYDKEREEDVRKSFLCIMPECVYDAYLGLDKEVKELREIKKEYEFLKNGKFGFLLKLILKIKRVSKIFMH